VNRNFQSPEDENNEPAEGGNVSSSSSASNQHASLVHLNNNPVDEPFIIHPGAISSILNLLPTITSETSPLVRLFTVVHRFSVNSKA
jgi:hypothetical protein